MREKGRMLAKLILSLFLLSMFAAPAEATTVTPASEFTLTLDEAVAIAQKDNIQIKQTAAQRQLKKIASDKANRNGRDISSTDGSYDARYTRDIAPRIAEINLEQADRVQASMNNIIMVQVEGAYYDLLKAEESVNIAQRSLERAQEQLRLAKVRLDAGTASNIEVLQAESGVAGAEAGLTAALNELSAKQRALNKALALDLATVIHTVAEVTFESETYDRSALLAQALEENYTLMENQVNLQAATWTFEQIKQYYGGTWQAREAEQNMILAQLQLQDSEATLINKVNNTYESYLAVMQQHQSLSKVMELRQEAYRLQQLKYEVGMSTFEEVKQSADDLKSAEADVMECVYSYNVLKTSLKYNVY